MVKYLKAINWASPPFKKKIICCLSSLSIDVVSWSVVCDVIFTSVFGEGASWGGDCGVSWSYLHGFLQETSVCASYRPFALLVEFV